MQTRILIEDVGALKAGSHSLPLETWASIAKTKGMQMIDICPRPEEAAAIIRSLREKPDYPEDTSDTPKLRRRKRAA